MSAAIEDRVCHTYLKYTGRRPGDGIMIEEPSDIEGGEPENVEVCGKLLVQHPDTSVEIATTGSTAPVYGVHSDWWYCPTCDRRPPAIPTPDPFARGFPGE